jgi:DNA-binding GntR family transcriptional regulator
MLSVVWRNARRPAHVLSGRGSVPGHARLGYSVSSRPHRHDQQDAAESERAPVPLREVAYRQLRDGIVKCRLVPGQRLTERQLAAETGLGISPVREALIRLDQDGLVRTLPRKGYQVKPLTIKDVDDLFSYFGLLGPEMVRLGAARATGQQAQRVTSVFENLGQLLSGEPLTEMAVGHAVRLLGEGFAALAESTQNGYMIASFYRLSSEMARVCTLVVRSDASVGGYLGDCGTELAKWPGMVSRRDGDAAAEAARDFIRQSHRRVMRTVARWPSVVTAEVVPLAQPGPAHPRH